MSLATRSDVRKNSLRSLYEFSKPPQLTVTAIYHVVLQLNVQGQTFRSRSLLPCSAARALRMPNATLLSYRVW